MDGAVSKGPKVGASAQRAAKAAPWLFRRFSTFLQDGLHFQDCFQDCLLDSVIGRLMCCSATASAAPPSGGAKIVIGGGVDSGTEGDTADAADNRRAFKRSNTGLGECNL